jgi:glycosyltransferase involved in cell wall biosynthesis
MQHRQNFEYLTAVVVKCLSPLNELRHCIQSIQNETENFELICACAEGDSEVASFLSTYPRLTVLTYSCEVDFANRLLPLVENLRCEFVALVDSQCIVTTGWLTGMLAVSLHDERNGLVGPMTNLGLGSQICSNEVIGDRDLQTIASQRKNTRQLMLTDCLGDFCLLFRRSMMVNLISSQSLPCIDSSSLRDICVVHGMRLVVATNVYVHQQAARLRESAPVRPQPAQVPCPKLSVCLIVRDNEKIIYGCIESIRPWVDEIVVVDTGSRDKTKSICEALGARVFDFEWCDDFSAARNESLRFASGEWILWMDSDDVIPEEQGRRLRELIDGPHDSRRLGYVMQVRCISKFANEMTVVDHVKMIRNLPGIRFEHRIHEQILPSIRRMNGEVGFTDIFLVHIGSSQVLKSRERKLDRDLRILHLDLMDRPGHPFVLFNLGMTNEDAGQYAQAEAFLRECIARSSIGESHLRKAWALLINCLKAQEQFDQAFEAATLALTVFPSDKELRFRRAALLQTIGRLREAESDYLAVLNDPDEQVFKSVDPSIVGYKAHHNLASTLHMLGEHDRAEHHWRLTIQSCPRFAPAWICLAKLYAQRNLHDSLGRLQAHVANFPDLVVPTAIINALHFEHTGNIEDATLALEHGWRVSNETDCLDELARLLTSHQHHERAIAVLRQLQNARGNDPAVLHNLGSSLCAVGQLNEGVAYLKQSLVLRPNASRTSEMLTKALLQLGRDSNDEILASPI